VGRRSEGGTNDFNGSGRDVYTRILYANICYKDLFTLFETERRYLLMGVKDIFRIPCPIHEGSFFLVAAKQEDPTPRHTYILYTGSYCGCKMRIRLSHAEIIRMGPEYEKLKLLQTVKIGKVGQ
jgi:hypothetical protein